MLSFAAIGFVSAFIAGVVGLDGNIDLSGIQAPSTAVSFCASLMMVFYAMAALALHPSRMREKDPAEAWPEDGVRDLVLAFPDGSLNGVLPGQPAGLLWPFGRPDNPAPSRDGKYIFRRLGLIVETEKGCIDYLAFVMEDVERLGLEPCRVTLALEREARLELGPGTLEGDIVAALGEPDERDEDAEERVHTYRRMGLRFELEYALDGRLRRLNVFRG
jgi:hypothetical protein